MDYFYINPTGVLKRFPCALKHPHLEIGNILNENKRVEGDKKTTALCGVKLHTFIIKDGGQTRIWDADTGFAPKANRFNILEQLNKYLEDEK